MIDKAMRRRFFIPLLLVALIFTSCKSPDYLSQPMEFGYRVKGLVIEVKTTDRNKVLGEIIEVGEGHILLLPVKDPASSIISLDRQDVKEADVIVATTSDKPGTIALWGGLQNILVLSHGAFAIITLPINLAISISLAQDAAKGTYRVKYPDNIEWEEMSKFARFPQGLPREISPELIH